MLSASASSKAQQPDLDIDLQIGNDVSHVMTQVPQGQAARMQGQVPGTACLAPHDSPAAL